MTKLFLILTLLAVTAVPLSAQIREAPSVDSFAIAGLKMGMTDPQIDNVESYTSWRYLSSNSSTQGTSNRVYLVTEDSIYGAVCLTPKNQNGICLHFDVATLDRKDGKVYRLDLWTEGFTKLDMKALNGFLSVVMNMVSAKLGKPSSLPLKPGDLSVADLTKDKHFTEKLQDGKEHLIIGIAAWIWSERKGKPKYRVALTVDELDGIFGVTLTFTDKNIEK